MSVFRIPAGFDPARPGPLPQGQSAETTGAAQRSARALSKRVEEAAASARDLDNVDGVDLNPEPGVVEVKDQNWKWMKMSGTLTYDLESKEVSSFDGSVGVNEYRLRANDKVRIYEWNDKDQNRKLTENLTTGTLTLFQG